MSNFENFKDSQFIGSCSLSDHATQSPKSNSSSSFLMSSHSTYSPEPQTLQHYISESSPKTMTFHNHSVESNFDKPQPYCQQHQQQQNQLQQLQASMHSNQGEFTATNDEIQQLKLHLKQKYKNYSESEIEEIIYKFINEYLKKMKNQGEQNYQASEENDESRSSLSTNIDWNDKQQLEKYCSKMKKIEKEEGFRPSQYFGAIDVEELEDGIDNPKIDCKFLPCQLYIELFTECFGIKPKPKKKKQTKPEVKMQEIHHQQQNQQYGASVNNQIIGNNNSNQNQIQVSQNNTIQNYWTFYILKNQDAPMTNEQEDNCAHILQDKSNKQPLHQQSFSNCQILHQEAKKSNSKVKSSHQDSLKKYMSPQELQKLQNAKNSAKSIIDSENTLDSVQCSKADDHKKGMIANFKLSSQTQLNSPQSIHFTKHNQQLSSLIGQPGSVKHASNQSLTHHSSMTSFNNNLSAKHKSNTSLTKQSFKSILYKQNSHHQQNMLSISSQQSIENKPKQMHKLSYLNQKQLLEQKSVNEHENLRNLPKPPPQQLNSKNKRDSNQQMDLGASIDSTGLDFLSGSPKNSPKTLLQIHNHDKPPTKIHTMSTIVNPNSYQFKSLFNQSVEKSDHTKTIGCLVDSGAQSGRSQGKTLGRNNSQNFYKTQNTLGNIQSFLMQSPEIDHDALSNPAIKYYDTETASPLGYSKTQIEMLSKPQTQNSNSRPQTTISGNFKVNHYLSNAQQLLPQSTHAARPPSKHVPKQPAAFLSHTSSAKNLKTMQKSINQSSTLQNSSRKQHDQDSGLPLKSSRQVQKFNHTAVQSHATSLSRERKERVIKSPENESMEKKRLHYKNQKGGASGKVLNQSGSQKQIVKSGITRNHQINAVQKGNSAQSMMSEYLRQQTKTNESSSQQSFNQTIQRINKSLDKIKQIYMNGKVVQVPQTTKNSEQKINDLFQQINSYKTFIKKAKPSVDSGSIQNSKSGFAQKASSKTRKDNPNFSIDNTSSLAAKKSSENFKKYLSGHGNANSGYNSFK